jgi:aconitate hydratase
MPALDPLGVRESLTVGTETLAVYRPDRLPGVSAQDWQSRPLVTRILLENLVRRFDPRLLDRQVLTALARGELAGSEQELPFYPGRVLLQDFTGVPLLVDLAALRAAAHRRGAAPERVNPRIPADLIVDHSVQVDSFGSPRSRLINLDQEYHRNRERYAFLRWGQEAFEQLQVVPPGNGICHQVNLEYLARVVERRTEEGELRAFPDTLVGTDSHTTMVNGLGVLGWGVGGIEAEAVLMGEPYFLKVPRVVGVRLTGSLPEGCTATDVVLTITKALRRKGVVDKFVEVFGPGVRHLSVPDRATLSNMSPEYGATACLFPVDEATLAYLRGTAREPAVVARVEAYARRLGLWHDPESPPAVYDELMELDLGTVVPTLSGPRNPDEALALPDVPAALAKALAGYRAHHPRAARPDPLSPDPPRDPADVPDGAVAIAAVTSCTNTSNPTVMIGAGLLAKEARSRGLHPPWWVKTSLAPGSKVVTEYLARAGLMAPLSELGFDVVGFGCTTCIGNSGPLIPEVEAAATKHGTYLVSVLSGNRNFEARIHNLVQANFLASPMLVVAYALAGRADLDVSREALGKDREGRPVFLKDLWPSGEEVRRVVESSLSPELFRDKYRDLLDGGPLWNSLAPPSDRLYAWPEGSTYLKEPPYFSLPPPPSPREGVLWEGARALAVFGDGISTDHISPAGEIPPDSPAGEYLLAHGVSEADFNTYGSRRGNHEVMVRGTFANVRIRNALAAGQEGGYTTHAPSGERMTIFAAAERYRKEGTPLLVLAGERYGQGSSRDWAAKGPALLGVRAVVARSYERIHRSNLVGMGILPLQFPEGQGVGSLGLTGLERYRLRLPPGGLAPRAELTLEASSDSGRSLSIPVRLRVESPVEMEYWRSGGLLPYVLERLLASPQGS